MNHFSVLAVVLCVFVGCNCAQTKIKLNGQGKYVTSFDDFNVDDVLGNDKLLKGYVECLLGGKRCTTQGKDLKALIPEALDTNCAKCTDKHKEQIRKVCEVLQKKHQDYWNQLLKYWKVTQEKADEFLRIIASKN